MTTTFFESLKMYVGFTAESSAALRELHPVAQPFFVPIVDDFYAAIEAHPDASAAITGGQAQIQRLKQTLLRWIDKMLLGPHDEAYYELRARIGRVHVRIALPQQYMFTAIDRIRVKLLDVVRTNIKDPAATQRIATALNQIIDLELAIMLETYREDLMQKNRNAERLATIGQFAASIGHELRNPLGVIESSLFLLRQHLGPEVAASHNVAKHLDRIGGEINRANKTIHDLLDLARNRPPRRQRTEVRAAVETAARAALLPATVSVEVAPSASGLTIDVDPDQVQQVLVNLFTNAMQAMSGDGHITVDGEPLPDGGTRLRVRDDGPGVPVEVRYRIFEALFTTKAKGSGLGLALCRRILEAHGGSIELEPSARGASFVLTFPPEPGGAAPAAA
jgi:two-component system sensor histidine kinase HydH